MADPALSVRLHDRPSPLRRYLFKNLVPGLADPNGRNRGADSCDRAKHEKDRIQAPGSQEGTTEPYPAWEPVDPKRTHQAPDKPDRLRDQRIGQGIADTQIKYGAVDARQPDHQAEVAEEACAPDQPCRQAPAEIFRSEQV